MPNFKPILFSTEMVQAILEGRKTQTRRIVKPQPSRQLFSVNMGYWSEEPKNLKHPYIKSKFEVGDVLWVRENWKPGAWHEDECKVAFDYKASPEILKTPWCYFEDASKFEELQMKWMDELLKVPDLHPSKVEGDEEKIYFNWLPGQSPLKWKPSIFMPKEACRIFLKIKSIKVERLQDISEENSRKEGVKHLIPNWKDYTEKAPCHYTAYGSFKSLWCSINNEKTWKDNPWVWLIEFERIEKPENFV